MKREIRFRCWDKKLNHMDYKSVIVANLGQDLNIKKYKLSSTAKRANYMMFRYENLDKLPFMIMYKNYNVVEFS